MALSPFPGGSFVPLGAHARSSLRGGRCAVPGELDREALTDGRGVRMTDTGQVPAEGLPENAGMVEQPGVAAHGAYTYLSETTAEDEDLLLLPGAQSAWGNEVAPPAPAPVVEAVHEPGPHETGGRDSGSVDLS